MGSWGGAGWCVSVFHEQAGDNTHSPRSDGEVKRYNPTANQPNFNKGGGGGGEKGALLVEEE